jgi:peptide/nickel transport system permease protein
MLHSLTPREGAMNANTSMLQAAIPTKHSSLWTDALRRLRRSSSGRIGGTFILVLLAISLLIPVIMPYNPRTDGDLTIRLEPPSQAHPFGTDDLGRDVLRRVLYGSRVSLGIALISVGIALSFGSTLGLVCGFLGGAVDLVTMRVIDIMLAFPATLLAIGIVAARGPGINNAMLAVGIVQIPAFTRLARSMAISIREREYITAAQCIGASRFRLLTRHVFPNSLSPIIVQATLSIASSILEAAALGFLGLGAQPPTPEWGAMLADGYKYLTIGAWWVLMFPGMFIMLTVLGYNLLGDGLRDALDPSLKT